MTDGRVAHVFPFDPRQLSSDSDGFIRQLFERWPLAAVARSRRAPQTSVHFVLPQARRTPGPPLELVGHRSRLSGPRWRDWGDDWSPSLGRYLRSLGPEDVCILHLNDYAAARLVHRAAHRTRVVLVFHGRGLGRADDHLLTADGHVALHEGAARGLRELGVPGDRIVVMPPSVDADLFRPADGLPNERVLGFVGRVEELKGVLDLPRVLEAIPGSRVEVVGAATAEQRAVLLAEAERLGVAGRLELLGELTHDEVADRVRSWRLLLFPSHTEGSPISVAEAATARVPVIAVEGVLPSEVEAQPGIHTAGRLRYPELAAEVLASGDRPPPAAWVPTHDEGGAAWDRLVDELPPWRPRVRIEAPTPGRVRRLRPLRRAARAVRRRVRG